MAAADLLTLDGDITAEAGRGLLAVPVRYRLQFLLLAGARLPRADEARIARTAAQLAQSLAIPPELSDGPAEDLDSWFKEHSAEILKRADALTRWYRLRFRALRRLKALWRR